MKQRAKIPKTKTSLKRFFLKGNYQENEKQATDLEKIFAKDI